MTHVFFVDDYFFEDEGADSGEKQEANEDEGDGGVVEKRRDPAAHVAACQGTDGDGSDEIPGIFRVAPVHAIGVVCRDEHDGHHAGAFGGVHIEIGKYEEERGNHEYAAADAQRRAENTYAAADGEEAGYK